MKKISIYARNFDLDPSTYYGMTQYYDGIKGHNFRYRELVNNFFFRVFRNKIWSIHFFKLIRILVLGFVSYVRLFFFLLCDLLSFKPSIIHVNRDAFPHCFPAILFLLYKKVLSKSIVVWSLDDNIFTGEISKKERDFLLKKSSLIYTNNDFLRSLIPDDFKEKLNEKCQKRPCDFDIDPETARLFLKKKEACFDDEFSLVWLGSSSGLDQVREIVPFLDNAASKINKRVVLNIVCDQPLRVSTHHLIVRNTRWTRKDAIETLYRSHVGLMPLKTSIFAKGKSAFKITQYKTAGLPTIASDFPVHRDKLRLGDGIIISSENQGVLWENAIIEMASNAKKWKKMSLICFEDIKNNYISKEEMIEQRKKMYEGL